MIGSVNYVLAFRAEEIGVPRRSLVRPDLCLSVPACVCCCNSYLFST